MKKFALTLVAAATAITGCQPVQLLNTITPSGNFTLAKDIAYGEMPRQTLDVYKPENAKVGAPIMVYVHGGGWDSGSKNDYKFIADSFTREGYTVVAINYRLHPNTVFPDPVTDTALATQWVANTYPGQPIVLVGHSAGAYNVLMTGLDPQYLEDANVERCKVVAGIISLAGPTGIVPLTDEPHITIFPDRFTGKDAPLNTASAASPPLLLLHGEDDKTVYPQNSTRLADKITARGGDVQTVIYRDVDHIEIVKVLSRYFDGDAGVKNDILNFLGTVDTTREDYCR